MDQKLEPLPTVANEPSFGPDESNKMKIVPFKKKKPPLQPIAEKPQSVIDILE